MFSFTCYLISTKSGSWEKGRKDCRARGADLVVIDSYEEQEFLINITKQASWIGLSDREKEGTWKWTDGTPLTQAYWATNQPDSGGEDMQWGEEDCVTVIPQLPTTYSWDDLSCDAPRQWICEKILSI
ncbi:CD209 antigen-like protein E [Thunnus albacares]|uniref:CD209 antigen-like protein E n=1 Tax=Thunnus albacares TaxID=8236 RepID=UPI001CF66B23|nr:CD209 antigen-like protein E [Thunnus albacares]